MEEENVTHGGAGGRWGGRKAATVKNICIDNPEEAADSINKLCVNERLLKNAKQLSNLLQSKLQARESKETKTIATDVNSDEGLTELAIKNKQTEFPG